MTTRTKWIVGVCGYLLVAMVTARQAYRQFTDACARPPDPFDIIGTPRERATITAIFWPIGLPMLLIDAAIGCDPHL
jgi:hypothetical protein